MLDHGVHVAYNVDGNCGGSPAVLSAGMPAWRLVNSIYWDGATGTNAVVSHSIVQTGGTGDGVVSQDPAFVRTPDDGGDGWNYGDANDDYGDLKLQFSSPAIDAGDNTFVPMDIWDLDGDGITTEAIPFDLAGGERHLDDETKDDEGIGTPPLIDIGAYEYQE